MGQRILWVRLQAQFVFSAGFFGPIAARFALRLAGQLGPGHQSPRAQGRQI
jgi:hypothetical protein